MKNFLLTVLFGFLATGTLLIVIGFVLRGVE
jgi:hypothetical protein